MKHWIRKASLYLKSGEKVLDLSDFRFTFQTVQIDEETPNNCVIRVYNVARTEIEAVTKEFTEVVLQAGYEDSFGVIFTGNIKQFRFGKETVTDTFLDILAADSDFLFKYGKVASSIPAGTPQSDALKTAVSAANDSVKAEASRVNQAPTTPTTGQLGQYPKTGFGGVYPRGKVMLGTMAELFRNYAAQSASTWSITNGVVNIIPYKQYLDTEVVEINVATGLIGMPETTEEGIKLKCLLNHKIFPGMRIRLNNKELNQTTLAKNSLPVAYNSYTKVQLMAAVASDGLYRVYVSEHAGDTRGNDWYTSITALAIDESTNEVKANN